MRDATATPATATSATSATAAAGAPAGPADPAPGRGPGLLRQTWIITLRDLKHWQREPWTPLFGIAFTIMLVLIFGYLMGGAIVVPGGGDYLPYLLPGMFALAMLFGLEGTMSAVADDAGRGVTDRLRSLPISGFAVLGGRAGADLANSAVELAVLMVGGLVVGWRTDAGVGAVLLAVALLLWLRFAMLWLGILLGLTLRGEGAVQAVQVLVWPVGFLSNVLVAPETMPGWLGFLAEWNPVSATAAACRELFGNPSGSTGGLLTDHAVLVAAAWPLVLSLVFVPLSVRAFRRLSG
jgi:ABC-2 type transport system permease protein